jgi:hypothetical protein
LATGTKEGGPGPRDFYYGLQGEEEEPPVQPYYDRAMVVTLNIKHIYYDDMWKYEHFTYNSKLQEFVEVSEPNVV